MPSQRTIFRFGVFELDSHRAELRRDGLKVPLQDLPLRLLLALVERPGEVVSRRELQEALWEPGVFVDAEAGLNTAVRRLREALGDDAANPRFVATVPRRGYRFVAPVESAGGAPAAAPGTWLGWAAAALAAVAALLLVLLLLENRGLGVSAEPPLPAGPLGDDAAVARELVLKGHHFADRRTHEGLEKAIAAFQSALLADPESAQAYSGLAKTYALLGVYDFWRPRDAFPLAERMARQALRYGPDSAEAQLAIGMNAAIVDWDWESARTHVERAVELAPEATEPRLWHGTLLSALGEHEAALGELRWARRIDPLSPVVTTALAWNLFLARRYDEAAEVTRETLELDPGYFDAWDNLAWIEIVRGDRAAGVDAWSRADALLGDDPDGPRRAFREKGFEGMVRGAIAEMLQRAEVGYQSPYDLVLLYTLIGEHERALDQLERSFAEHETDLVGLAVDPRLDPLRPAPRFRAILDRLELPPAGEVEAGGMTPASR